MLYPFSHYSPSLFCFAPLFLELVYVSKSTFPFPFLLVSVEDTCKANAQRQDGYAVAFVLGDWSYSPAPARKWRGDAIADTELAFTVVNDDMIVLFKLRLIYGKALVVRLSRPGGPCDPPAIRSITAVLMTRAYILGRPTGIPQILPAMPRGLRVLRIYYDFMAECDTIAIQLGRCLGIPKITSL
jgi:hypothetical protein